MALPKSLKVQALICFSLALIIGFLGTFAWTSQKWSGIVAALFSVFFLYVTWSLLNPVKDKDQVPPEYYPSFEQQMNIVLLAMPEQDREWFKSTAPDVFSTAPEPVPVDVPKSVPVDLLEIGDYYARVKSASFGSSTHGFPYIHLVLILHEGLDSERVVKHNIYQPKNPKNREFFWTQIAALGINILLPLNQIPRWVVGKWVTLRVKHNDSILVHCNADFITETNFGGESHTYPV